MILTFQRMVVLSAVAICLTVAMADIAIAEVIGNPAVGTDVDSTGNPGDIIYDETTALVTTDGRLTSWSFYDDDDFDPDRIVTPMIIRDQAGSMSITGIGQARVTTESGLQTYSFELQSGSDEVFADGTYYFGFRNGTADGTTINLGAADAEWSGNTSRYFILGNSATPVGPLAAENYPFEATYSYNGTVTPIQDQPAEAVPGLSQWSELILLLLLSAVALLYMRKFNFLTR